MSNKQHKINIVLNQNLPLFGILCLCGVIYLGFVTSYWFLMFLILIPLVFLNRKINWQQWLTSGIIVLLFVLLVIFAQNFSLIKLINKRPKIIKNSILNFFDNNYGQEISSFLKLILLNIKSSETWIFYKQTVDLGIMWLICISGFHVSLISKIIKWIFKKRPKIGKYVSITIVGFYSFLLDFSYGSLRVFFKLVYDWIFFKFQIKRYDKLGFIGLTLCLTNPVCFISYGFLLSFLISAAAYYVSSLELNNRIINSLLINVLAFIIIIPFAIEMNNKISLLTFINAFVCSYFSSIIFLYLLIFAWMPFMAIVHHGIMLFTYVMVGNISFSNVFIYSVTWPIWGCFIYYAGVLGLTKVVYLIVYNNKI